MQASDKIIVALDLWEGNPATVYLDPVGKPTVGKGMTNSSQTVTSMLGKLKPGKKYDPDLLNKVFKEALKNEYEPMIDMPGAQQHEYDVGVSTVWNLGGRCMKWQWAKLWRAGRKNASADYLASHYNTAGGRKLAGLVRRRKEEAEILRSGIYPQDIIEGEYEVVFEGVKRDTRMTRPSAADPVTKEAQTALERLGFELGDVDGWYGPRTRAAILAYQRTHPHLVNDGILGPATIAQLRRDITAVKDTVAKGTGTVGGIGFASFLGGLPWGWIVGLVLVAVIAYFAWKWRDVWTRRINKMFNRVVNI